MSFLVSQELFFWKSGIVKQQINDQLVTMIIVSADHHSVQTGVPIGALDIDVSTESQQLTNHLNIFIFDRNVDRCPAFLVLEVEAVDANVFSNLLDILNVVIACCLKN